ncbi:DoxX family membrane protein [Chloroflexi bacterium TSY]|nr:DoxX family membrane protein [Chloroflexi bacterium TSY]
MFQAIEKPIAQPVPQWVTTISTYINDQFQQSNAYLLPVRLFLGLGWLRAGVEKIIEPSWHNGDALIAFLQQQLAADAVYFPFYQTLIVHLFLPNAAILAWIILIGELLAGLAIITGTLTNLALLGGLFMNVNFVLAGVVNPSAFYIVIQSMLLCSNAGTTLGGDALLSKRIRSVFVVAQPEFKPQERIFEKWCFLILAILSAVAALSVIPFIRDYSPHSVDDPAMLLFILSGLGSLLSMILFLRMAERNKKAVKIS